jgi:hypothetical protein
MRKIFINKNNTEEEVSRAIEREPDDEITLVLPRGAKAGTTEALQAMRAKAEDLGKTFSIESVDEKLVAHAQSLSIVARHPFLNIQGQSLSDIVPPHPKGRASVPSKTSKKHAEPRHETEEDHRAIAIPIHIEEDEKKETDVFYPSEPRASAGTPSTDYQTAHPNRLNSADIQEEGDPVPSRKGRKFLFGLIVFVAIIAAGIWITDAFFSWATVSIHFKTVSWNKTDALTGDKAATQFNTANKTIPAEVFDQQKTDQRFFAATGHATSSQRSSGTITIFNNYSANPQQLVATTRFQTVDGKIYRLVAGVTVPGAAGTAGKIVASSIDAQVIADASGPQYDLSTPEKLSIPGFSGTAKAAGFYGVVKSISGGAVGDTLVVSDQDIQDAKSKETQFLKSWLSDPSLNNRPEDLKVMDGADDFQINKMTVDTTLNASSEFSVYASASYRAIAIKESDVKSVFHDEAMADLKDTFVPDFDLQNFQIAYSDVKPDFDNGTLEFSAAVQSTATPSFSPTDFASTVAGMTLSNARAALAGVSGLADGKISIWPFWLQTMPAAPGKIRVDVN